jgi:hypothetical protein
MAKLDQRARPVMRRPAGSEPDKTRGQRSENSNCLLCLIVLRDHNAPRNINAMNLKGELGQIEANSHDFKQMARLFIVPDAARAPSIPSREPWWNRPARQYACQFPLRNSDADSG